MTSYKEESDVVRVKNILQDKLGVFFLMRKTCRLLQLKLLFKTENESATSFIIDSSFHVTLESKTLKVF